MKTATSTPVAEGRTRWRRFGVATVPTVAVAAGVVYLAATGAIAVSFSMSGIPFKLSASTMTGTGFTQYGTVDPVTNNTSGALVPSGSTQTVGGKTYDAATVTVMSSADISNLHQTVCAPIPAPLGSILPKNKLLVTIDAGGGGTPAHAAGLVVDAPLLTASDATFTNINIGQDLGTALGGDADGNFAQHADSVVINNMNQLSIGTSAGTFKLTGLNLSATFVNTCP